MGSFILHNTFSWCVKSESKCIKKEPLQWFLFVVRVQFQVQEMTLVYLPHFSHLPSLQPSGIISTLLLPCFLCPWDIHAYTPSVWNTAPDSFDPPNSQSPLRSQLTHPFFCKALPDPPASWLQTTPMPSHGKHSILLNCPALHTAVVLVGLSLWQQEGWPVFHLTLSSSWLRTWCIVGAQPKLLE